MPLRDLFQMPIPENVRVRLRSEEGFGLIELLMAMVLLNIGILAIVASFNSGAVALTRASHISTASALADQQMEGYRALLYGQIGFDTSRMSALDNTYKCDSVLAAWPTVQAQMAEAETLLRQMPKT